MKNALLNVILPGFAIGACAALASPDKSTPTCDEKPTLRDCVKVEDPDATAPAPSVYRQKKPAHPIGGQSQPLEPPKPGDDFCIVLS